VRCGSQATTKTVRGLASTHLPYSALPPCVPRDPQLSFSYAWSARKVLVAAWELWMLLEDLYNCTTPATSALLADRDSPAVMAVRVTSYRHRISTFACSLDVSASSRELRRRPDIAQRRVWRGPWNLGKTQGSLTWCFSVFVSLSLSADHVRHILYI
jgi:hypothetical protein